ncbi:phosphate ABC transporter, permease protein PstA, partial [Rhizobium brockwellii]
MATHSGSLYRRRHIGSMFELSLCCIATVVVLVFLVWILWTSLI